MHVPLVVALYGRSLILASVGTRLEGSPRFRVVTVEGPVMAAALAALAPDVLIVDLGTIEIASALALLTDRPEMLLVGLEASGARLLVLSGNQARTLTTDDLVGLIEQRVESAPRRT